MFYSGALVDKETLDEVRGTVYYPLALFTYLIFWGMVWSLIIIPIIFGVGFLLLTFNTPGFWLAVGLVLLWELNKRVGKKRKPS